MKTDFEPFLQTLLPSFPEPLHQIQQEAFEEKIPIVPHETAWFLAWLMKLKQPQKILEIGTAVGFSAGLLCTYAGNSARVTTIDRYPIMLESAYKNIQKMNLQDRIQILEGDAGEILLSLNECFDFIFLDAAKGQYISFLPECLRLLKKGGILVADDVLKGGEVTKPRFSVPRRQRTTHKRLRSFLWEITHTSELSTSVIPVGGGLALCQKL